MASVLVSLKHLTLFTTTTFNNFTAPSGANKGDNMINQTEQQLRDAEIEVAYQYLRQKDWERMNKKRELMSWTGLTVMMIGLAGLALGGVNLVLFGGL